MSHRIIVEATIKLVLDVDTDGLEDEYPDISREDILEKATEQFSENTDYNFGHTENVTVVSKYSEFRDIEIKHK